jgi:hypothetical protein
MSLTLALAALTTPAISCPNGGIDSECSRAEVEQVVVRAEPKRH